MAQSERSWGHGRGNWSRYPMGRKHGWTDLGAGVYIRPAYGDDAHEDEELNTDEIEGFYLAHKHHQTRSPRRAAKWHVEYLPLHGHEGAGAAWHLLSGDPYLTLAPAIIVEDDDGDTPCLQGHVINGKWVHEHEARP